MAKSSLPDETRNLTPGQVAALAKRRDVGHTFLALAAQLALIAVVFLAWVGRDLTYSLGWKHPLLYYFILALIIVAIVGAAGFLLRRGTPHID